MKNRIFKLLLAILCLSSSTSALAYDFEVDGIYYNILSLENLTCEVTYNAENRISSNMSFNANRGNSDSHYYVTTSYPSYSGSVIVPSKVIYKGRELTVTGIGEYAFLDCKDLTSLSLPSTISDIKELVVSSSSGCYAGAFDYCKIETLTAGNAYTLHMFNQSYAYAAYDSEYRTRYNLKNLILANDFTGIIDVDYSSYSKLVSLRCNAIEPPVFSDETHFSNNQYLNMLVSVPLMSLEQYKISLPWSFFWDIVSLDNTLPPPAQLTSYDFEVDDIYYNILSLENLTCEVTYNAENRISSNMSFNANRGNSNSHYYVTTSYPSYSGSVIVPSKVIYKGRELTVTGIGEYAFLDCKDLTSLSLPSTISDIKELVVSSSSGCYAGAFDYCKIETLTVGNAYTLHMFNQSYAYAAYDSEYRTRYNLKNLILANDFTGIIDVDYNSYSKLVSLRCNAIEPPVFSDGTHFSNDQCLNLDVWVPEDAYAVYQSADIWKNFWELKAMKPVETITLNQDSLSLEPKQTYQLLPTVFPEDAFDTSVVWSSSNTAVATVNDNGLVTAITKGDAIIIATATDGSGVTAECAIHVDLLAKEIQLSETELGLEPGNSKQLQVTITPTDAFVKDVVWHSDSDEIVSVDQNGNVTANNIGIANISVSTMDGSNLTATCKVTVAELVKSIVVTPAVATIKEGNTLQLSYSITPETATYKAVIWSSDDNDIATVDNDGLVTAISSGTTTIKATAQDGSQVFGKCELTVIAETVEHNGICYQRNSLSTLKIVANTEHPYSGDFFIPSQALFNGLEMAVTEIGTGAFANCNELTRLVISNTIEKIQEDAFSGCSNLVYVKICDGSTLITNIDSIFPDSPINEIYVGSDGITYNTDSRILGMLKGMTLGNSVTMFPSAKVFNNLKYFIVEDGEMPIIESDEYLSKSMSLISQQTIKNSNTHIYYRIYYMITYTHLSPIFTALQKSVLDYIYIGREIQGVEVDTSLTQETIPTIAGSRYQEYGYQDEVYYQYQEIIATSDYNRNPIETITLDKDVVELNIGESIKLTVNFTPTNASLTAVEWISSNDQIAIVDIFGNVMKLAEGEAEITATTTDGTNLSAKCKITDFGTGLTNMFIDNFAEFDVFNLQGTLIGKKINMSNLKNLSPGVYIIQQGKTVKKVLVK